MSLDELKGTPFTTKYATNKNPSPAYQKAVSNVRTAPKGTVISKSSNPSLGLPQKAIDAIANPVGTYFTVIGDAWSLLLGTREQKVKTVLPYLPVTNIKPVVESVDKTIETQKTTTEGKQFWEQPVLGSTNITVPKLPDVFGFLGDLGRWALIGGIGLIAILFLTRRE